ncbi:hypothetical protein [Brachyspira murdochii]|uniref:hypothetical protein n=1 Tax=Brachyspira murdochii TaxID=84378 RepID=UPI0012F500CE|nr:hypothetical protein [Brachyspira murdochii]
MKKLILIILLIFSSLYADDTFNISDNSLKVLHDAGVEINQEQKENINLIVKKYMPYIKQLLLEIKDIESKLNNEYKKTDVNLNIIKKLLFEKKTKEADFDYIIMSCDLDILELFSNDDIKRIKYYIIFKK